MTLKMIGLFAGIYYTHVYGKGASYFFLFLFQVNSRVFRPEKLGLGMLPIPEWSHTGTSGSNLQKDFARCPIKEVLSD